MKIKNTKIYGLRESIVKSGYPMQIGEPESLNYKTVNYNEFKEIEYDILNNINRANKLANTPIGSGHNNFLKGIIVQFDLKYPQYFTPQLQRYNFIDIISSQSKMHKLTSVKDIGEHCNKYVLHSVIQLINKMIFIYNNYSENLNDTKIHTSLELIGTHCKNKQDLFHYIISNLPMGYELWMGISTNYLQLKTIYNQRKNHRLEEWKYFCNWIKSLPLSEQLIIIE